MPCSLTWLRFIIPLSLIALSLLLLALAHLPRPVRRALRPITDIFHDPASLAAVAELPESLLRAPAADESDELDAPKPEEADGGGDTAAGALSSSRPPPARTTIFSPEAVLAALNDSARSLGWRHVAFIALGTVQAAFWFAWMGWSVAYAAEGAGADAWKVWMSFGIGASWVSPPPPSPLARLTASRALPAPPALHRRRPPPLAQHPALLHLGTRLPLAPRMLHRRTHRRRLCPRRPWRLPAARLDAHPPRRVAQHCLVSGAADRGRGHAHG